MICPSSRKIRREGIQIHLCAQDVAGIPAEEQLLGYRHSLADEASLLDNGISADAVISLSRATQASSCFSFGTEVAL